MFEGIHSGGARRQLSGAMVKHKRGRGANTKLSKEPTNCVREGNIREHPQRGDRGGVWSNTPKGLHIMGDRVLGGKPCPIAPSRPAEDPPCICPRKRVLRHWWWRPVPQPARTARARWSIGDYQCASNHGGDAAAAGLGQHHLAGAIGVGDLKTSALGNHGWWYECFLWYILMGCCDDMNVFWWYILMGCCANHGLWTCRSLYRF